MRLGSVNFGDKVDFRQSSILFLNPGSKNTELKKFLQSNQPSENQNFLPNIHGNFNISDSSVAYIDGANHITTT